MSSRIERFREILDQAGLDGAVVRLPENVYYLTQVEFLSFRPCFAIVSPDRTILVAPSFGLEPPEGIELAGYDMPGATIDRVVDPEKTAATALLAGVADAGLSDKRLGIEDSVTSFQHLTDLSRHATLVPLRDEIAGLRRQKDEGELQLIRNAIGCIEAGFAAVKEAAQVGKSEIEIFLAASDAIQGTAGTTTDLGDWNNCFISGPRTYEIVGPPGTRRVEEGDLMILDLNPVVNHYKGDVTRTFSIGEPSDRQRALHDLLVQGHDQAMANVGPGTTAHEVDAIFRNILVGAGYGDYLIGHFGHGIGLQHLERPYIIPGDDMPLKENMVIALEPGAYIPGDFGMRFEQNYLVTSNGLESLVSYPRELVVCG